MQALAVQGGLHDGAGAFPDLDGIVLDPPGLGQYLIVFELMLALLGPRVIEEHESGAGRALVDTAYEVSHCVLPSRIARLAVSSCPVRNDHTGRTVSGLRARGRDRQR